MNLLDDTMELIRAGLWQENCCDTYVEKIINDMSNVEFLTMLSNYLEEQKEK